jgi:DDE superfamily endonuclease
MLTLQDEFSTIVSHFAPLLSGRVWAHAQVLLIGTILARGQRTVAAALRVMGLSDEAGFVNYHRVLQRAVWSNLALSRALWHLLVRTFAPSGTLVIGGDETIERRRGERIQAKGIYRDPVRSSHSHFVKASGLRWVTLMLLVPIPFAQRVWALPFLTMLAPSERYYAGRARAAKKLTDWMRQALLQVRRWLPERPLVFVADSSYACLELLWAMTHLAQPITMVVRFRMDAALFAPVPPRKPGTNGRPRKRGPRVPKLTEVAAEPTTVWQRQVVPCWYGERQRPIEWTSATAVWSNSGQPVVPIRWLVVRDPLGRFRTQALLCTDLTAQPEQIVAWFIQRWQLEVTLREVREHLGVETQRQWSERAIARTTPALFGLFSLVTILAQSLARRGRVLARQTAWYAKPQPTFSDALAAVRYELWRLPAFHVSHFNRLIAKLPAAIFNRFADALCYST